MEANLDKAYELYRLHKYDLVHSEVDSFIAREPENARAYALKALAYLEEKEANGALQNARKALSLKPDDDYLHYILSMVHLSLTRDYKEAELAINQALSINPRSAGYYDVLAQLQMIKRSYKKALQSIEQGLALEPENVDCLSTRALVLTKLGKNKNASRDLEEALRSDPENPQTLAGAGWVRLENGDHKGALEAFRSALKIKPDYEYARDGLIRALNARNFLFRQYLKYVFWINRLGQGFRWGLLIGVFLLVRFLSHVPALRPLIGLYVIFVLSTWLIDPIFNLFLRFDKFGKYALAKNDYVASNFVAASAVLAMAVSIVSLIIGDFRLLFGALALFMIIIPVSGTASFSSENQGKYRKSLIFTIFLAAVMAAGFAVFPFFPVAGVTLFAITLAGSVLFTWTVAIAR